MIVENVFHQLLGLGECWSVTGVDYEPEANRFIIVITETEKLWPSQRCPKPACQCQPITCYDHADTRAWRHLDVFGKKSEILCAVPRGQCTTCGHIYRVKVPWEGEGKQDRKSVV